MCETAGFTGEQAEIITVEHDRKVSPDVAPSDYNLFQFFYKVLTFVRENKLKSLGKCKKASWAFIFFLKKKKKNSERTDERNYPKDNKTANCSSLNMLKKVLFLFKLNQHLTFKYKAIQTKSIQLQMPTITKINFQSLIASGFLQHNIQGFKL